MTRAKTKGWSYSAGERGRNRVRAYEDGNRGSIFYEFYERLPGTNSMRRTRVSAGHVDRAAAKTEADKLAAEFGKNERPRPREVTLGTLFDIYVREVTPNKGDGKRRHDIRCVELFSRFFRRDKKPSTLNRRDWDRFIQERRSGRLRPPGRVGKLKNAGVGDRVVAYDLRFLMSVLNWATLSGDGEGAALLERNPLKGLVIPKEENPSRPMLTEEEYLKMRTIAPSIDPLFELALVLAHETGHRISSIASLRWSDVDLDRGSITWRAENDKLGMNHVTPLSSEAVRQLDAARRRRLAIGDGWIFPSPENPNRHASRHLTRDWWQRGEQGAEIERRTQRGWHSLRRKFVNDLKRDTPMADLCRLGGWKSAMTVMTVYQQADEATMRTALENREKRRAGA
jgi:integrase